MFSISLPENLLTSRRTPLRSAAERYELSIVAPPSRPVLRYQTRRSARASSLRSKLKGRGSWFAVVIPVTTSVGVQTHREAARSRVSLPVSQSVLRPESTQERSGHTASVSHFITYAAPQQRRIASMETYNDRLTRSERRLPANRLCHRSTIRQRHRVREHARPEIGLNMADVTSDRNKRPGRR